ncbi:MAG: VCBS repeat-containing protein [Ilumatobacteraceae bacterium]|nr:VCBS repeat-containing protein [Ilumatobacteraceae bacterium]
MSDDTTSSADIGLLTEASTVLPAGVGPPSMSDATATWGLNNRTPATANTGADSAAGGLALGDLDLDGDLDLVVAHDTLDVYLWEGSSYQTPLTLVTNGARGVTIADVDSDQWPDLLVARRGAVDSVLWGGQWVRDRTGTPAQTDLPGAAPSTALMAAELSGDNTIDIVSLGRGEAGAPDVLWVGDATGTRTFAATRLGSGSQLSLAGEIVDVDADGLLDIWVTRDIGWEVGGDSVYSRQGDVVGEWTDVADQLGVALEIDGMGLTVADLNGDLELDAYVSDLGDNQVLLGDGDGFADVTETGAARIRPPGAASNVVSSSWASGIADLNLDGHLDLVVANGGFPDGSTLNKIPGTDIALIDPPAVLIGAGNGNFTDTWPELELAWTSASRGLTIGDVDDDGDADIIFVSVDGVVTALANDVAGPSVAVRPVAGCDPTGAIVTLTQSVGAFQAPLTRHTYAGAHAPELVIGVPGTDAAVEVAWPTGETFKRELNGNSESSEIEIECPNTGGHDS